MGSAVFTHTTIAGGGNEEEEVLTGRAVVTPRPSLIINNNGGGGARSRVVRGLFLYTSLSYYEVNRATALPRMLLCDRRYIPPRMWE